MVKAKVTVVKLPIHEDLASKYVNKERYPNGFGPCALWKLGHEFIIDDFPTRPEGFTCDWAWADIQRDIAMVMFGGTPPWMGNEGTAITCCSDGLRPVSFLIERIDEEPNPG